MKMRGTIRAIRAAAAAAIACAILAGCALTTADSVTDYNSRILEYHPYVGDSVYSESLLNLVYDAAGLLRGRFQMTYNGDGKITRTDCYSYDTEGTKTYNGYYVYTYNVDGNILTGKTYNASDVQVQGYEVAYDATFTTCYTVIEDYTGTGPSPTTTTEEEVVTYQKEPLDPGYGNYRTKQHFAYDSSGAKSLTSETAAWYTTDSKANVIVHNELYHVLKGSGLDILPSGRDEAYYYTTYSYDPAGNKFLEADYWYGETSTKIPPAADPMITARDATYFNYGDPDGGADDDPFTYTIDLDYVKDLAQMTVYEFDEYQNCTKASLYSYGVLQEVKVYGYKDKDHISERSRYVDGGVTLEQRDAIRYYDVDLDGVTYQVQETTTYYYGSAAADAADNAVPGSAWTARGSRPSLVRLPDFNPIAASADALVAAHGKHLSMKTRNIHE
jgi:hypothetical protein